MSCHSEQMSLQPFCKTDRLRDLISCNSRLLVTISHFGISMGFGDATVHEVCERHNVDIPTFLTVANFLSQRPYTVSAVKVAPLMEYLKGTHTYFLDFFLPSIRHKLIEAVTYGGGNDIEVSLLLLRFFDEYVEEISCHMKHENDKVFKHIDNLLENHSHSGIPCPGGLFSDQHDDVARRLQELKNVIIGFVPQRDSNLMNSALLDIITCEKEIIDHCAIEDELFEPAVRRLEKTYMFRNETADENTNGTAIAAPDKISQQVETLSAREKEIIRLVACGMSNKEIAERLFLSVHTVTTHRRNLSQKLNIHSPAALTIFAIIHRLVDLDDIRSLNSDKL